MTVYKKICQSLDAFENDSKYVGVDLYIKQNRYVVFRFPRALACTTSTHIEYKIYYYLQNKQHHVAMDQHEFPSWELQSECQLVSM